ncbi:MAG: response regulator transcription factor [Pararhizobium sp.]
MTTETIIVVDDHPVFRDGLRALIGRRLPLATVIASDTLEDALAIARRGGKPPSMFLLDLFFSRHSILETLPALRQEFRQSSIVIISMTDALATVDAAMACGINGFINKAVSPEAMIAAIEAVRNGDLVLLLPDTAGGEGAAGEAEARPLSLTDRQSAVLMLIAEGKSNKEIGIALGISPFTVRIHVSALFRALGVASRAAAVAKGAAEGLLVTRQP